MARGNGAIAMTEGPLLGILVRVAIPIALTNLVQSSYDLVNAFWLGRLGEEAIAAVTASGPIFGVLISLAAAFRPRARCGSRRMPGRSASTRSTTSPHKRC